jgi:hypothetical protein
VDLRARRQLAPPGRAWQLAAFIVLRWFYPGEALIVAFILACVPYLLLRGPVNRMGRRWQRRAAASGPSSGRAG